MNETYCEHCNRRTYRNGTKGRFPRFCDRACQLAFYRDQRQSERRATKTYCRHCNGPIPVYLKLNAIYCGDQCTLRARALREGRVSVPPAEQRFWSRIDKSDPNGCWIWTGARLASGYGSLRVNNVAVVTHRFAWELLRGPIADGLQVDHLCRARACCNPDHLEPVTQQENLRRARLAS